MLAVYVCCLRFSPQYCHKTRTTTKPRLNIYKTMLKWAMLKDRILCSHWNNVIRDYLRTQEDTDQIIWLMPLHNQGYNYNTYTFYFIWAHPSPGKSWWTPPRENYFYFLAPSPLFHHLPGSRLARKSLGKLAGDESFPERQPILIWVIYT